MRRSGWSGSGVPKGAGVAGDAGVELAVGGGHGEFGDGALGDGGVGGHLGRGRMGGAEDEVAVFVGGREGRVGKFGGADVAGGVGIAGGVGAGLLGECGEGECREECECAGHHVRNSHDSRF